MNHPRRAQIDQLRTIILASDVRISESVKWNAPSYAIQEHFATFKLQPKMTVQLIFHTGAKVKENVSQIEVDDPSKLLRWITSDRAVMTFDEGEGVSEIKNALAAIIKQWVKYVKETQL